MIFFLGLLFSLVTASDAVAVAFAPMVTDVAVMPGEQTSIAYSIENTAATEKSYAVSLYDVTLQAAIESPVFAPLGADHAAWFSVETYNFSLAPGASRALALNVHPPSNASNDSVVLGLVVREIGEDNAIALTSGVTGLVFITIGTPDAHATVTAFSLRPRIASTLERTIDATVVNDGARVVQPYGTIRVTNMFGRLVDEVDVNPAMRRVPEEDTRTFTVDLHAENAQGFFDKLWREVIDHRIGIFTATLVAAPYPGADATLYATKRFVVFPWRSAVILCVLAVGTTMLVRRARRS